METSKGKGYLLPKAELKHQIESKFNLKNLIFHLLDNTRNTLYAIENKSCRYFFKVYERNRDIDVIKAEIELVKLLYDQGVNVSYPIVDEEGNFIQHFRIPDSILYGVLYSFADGEAVNFRNEKQLANAGRELAMMHNITLGLELKYPMKECTLQGMITESLITLKPIFVNFEKEYNYLKDTSQRVLKRFENLNLTELDFGYCHNDFDPSNFNFEEDDSITIFDFDSAGKGYLVLDIACIYSYYFLNVKIGWISFEDAAKAFNIFMKGYLTIRNLSTVEFEAIPYLCFAKLVHSLISKCEHYLDTLPPDFLKIYVGWLKELVDGEIFSSQNVSE